MRKIPTLFARDLDDPRFVTRAVTPGCEWVLAGEGTPTRKYDGTCVMLDHGTWWARREVKPGKEFPEHFEPVETDPVTGKTVGWELAEHSSFYKYLLEALKEWVPPTDSGTYELIGPKINGNPEKWALHYLVRHGEYQLAGVPLHYDGLQRWLQTREFEGIVWWHLDGRMAKLKKRDFPKC